MIINIVLDVFMFMTSYVSVNNHFTAAKGNIAAGQQGSGWDPGREGGITLSNV